MQNRHRRTCFDPRRGKDCKKDMRYCKMLLAFAWLTVCSLQWTGHAYAQINTDRVMLMGRNALYYEDYVLAIQRFNMVINAKPWLGEPYFFRGLA